MLDEAVIVHSDPHTALMSRRGLAGLVVVFLMIGAVALMLTVGGQVAPQHITRHCTTFGECAKFATIIVVVLLAAVIIPLAACGAVRQGDTATVTAYEERAQQKVDKQKAAIKAYAAAVPTQHRYATRRSTLFAQEAASQKVHAGRKGSVK